MPQEWRAYLDRHNDLVQFSSEICRATHQASVPWFIENPASRDAGVAFWKSMQHRCLMWHMLQMRGLKEELGAEEVTFAQCQFASEY